jgi:hypothetical protein
VKEEVDDEMLVSCGGRSEQMLGVAAHTGVVRAWRGRADMNGIYMCVLHFVATLLHLVVVLVLLAHGVVHSTFLLARAGSTEEMKRSRTLASSVIMLLERLASGVQRIRAGEQQFPKLCLRRAALQWSSQSREPRLRRSQTPDATHVLKQRVDQPRVIRVRPFVLCHRQKSCSTPWWRT